VSDPIHNDDGYTYAKHHEEIPNILMLNLVPVGPIGEMVEVFDITC
jgi:hypothetical protein